MQIDVNTDSVCYRSEDVVAREIQGEMIIIPLAAGIGDMEDEFYSLNETGRAIWSRLDGVKTLHEISTELVEDYDAPLEDIERDVTGLVTELVRRGILVVA